ncbi:Hypothetical protein CINCED_3A023671 [Cinara cedri]|uniref:Uncharacterized protein n=1 Tax=Cinara cedri TaxID=506608 RepID=A0A5E4M9L0_9HEMI|nr:Hypothetical protein CINCED_3A023671 [Cinara cedri]
MVNIPQGLKTTPVASTAQNFHEPSLIVAIVQPQLMEMTSNSQPLQVQQQQSSTPMQPQEPRPPKKIKTLIKIIHPKTEVEIDLLYNEVQESDITLLGSSLKWLFSNNSYSESKNSSFTSSNIFGILIDEKKLSTISQTMSKINILRKPIISESEERQRVMSASMMPQYAQTSLTLNSISSLQSSKETTNIEKPDIVYSLTDDANSVIKTQHQEFVTAMIFTALDSSPNSRTEAGKIFAEVLSYKHKDYDEVISVVDVTQG